MPIKQRMLCLKHYVHSDSNPNLDLLQKGAMNDSQLLFRCQKQLFQSDASALSVLSGTEPLCLLLALTDAFSLSVRPEYSSPSHFSDYAAEFLRTAKLLPCANSTASF